MEGLLSIVLGYLIGSFPTAYIAGRMLKGVDLRRYGSGTVSGTAVLSYAGRWPFLLVGLVDVAKGALVTWLTLAIGWGLTVAVLGGLAAVVGHNWPIYIGFRGGRGLSPFMGMMAVAFLGGAVWILAFLTLGKLLRFSGGVVLLGVATLPFLSWAMGQPAAVTWDGVGMLLLTIVKRLEANRLPLPTSPAERRKVLLRRLFMDRDVGPREPWVERGPIADM